MEWKVGDVTREALVSVPENPARAPVIFLWHGHGGTMKSAATRFALHKLWAEAIVAYPQGLPTPGKLVDPEGKLPGWQSNPGQQDDRDLKFFDAMLATFTNDLKADARRVYVAGHFERRHVSCTNSGPCVPTRSRPARLRQPRDGLDRADEAEAVPAHRW